MNVALPDEIEKRVDESVRRGEFANREQFFARAAQLLLDLGCNDGQPLAVDVEWEGRVEALVEEGQASGEPTEMTDAYWEEVERRGFLLMKARKKK